MDKQITSPSSNNTNEDFTVQEHIPSSNELQKCVIQDSTTSLISKEQKPQSIELDDKANSKFPTQDETKDLNEENLKLSQMKSNEKVMALETGSIDENNNKNEPISKHKNNNENRDLSNFQMEMSLYDREINSKEDCYESHNDNQGLSTNNFEKPYRSSKNYRFAKKERYTNKTKIIKNKSPRNYLKNYLLENFGVATLQDCIYSQYYSRSIQADLHKFDEFMIEAIFDEIFNYINQILSHHYGNYFLQGLFKFLSKSQRLIFISEIMVSLNNKYNYNSTYLFAIRSIIQDDLTVQEQKIVVAEIQKSIDELVHNPQVTVILETIIILFSKHLVIELELSIIRNAHLIMKSLNGVHLLYKIIFSNSVGSLDDYSDICKCVNKKISNSQIQILHDQSKNNIEIYLDHSKKVCKNIIKEICSNFFEVASTVYGKNLIKNMVKRLSSTPFLSKYVKLFVKLIPPIDIIDCSIAKNPSALILFLMKFSDIHKKVLEETAIDDSNFEDFDQIKSSGLYALVTSLRGIVVLKAALEYSDKVVIKKVYRNLKKIRDIYVANDQMNVSKFSELLETLRLFLNSPNKLLSFAEFEQNGIASKEKLDNSNSDELSSEECDSFIKHQSERKYKRNLSLNKRTLKKKDKDRNEMKEISVFEGSRKLIKKSEKNQNNQQKANLSTKQNDKKEEVHVPTSKMETGDLALSQMSPISISTNDLLDFNNYKENEWKSHQKTSEEVESININDLTLSKVEVKEDLFLQNKSNVNISTSIFDNNLNNSCNNSNFRIENPYEKFKISKNYSLSKLDESKNPNLNNKELYNYNNIYSNNIYLFNSNKKSLLAESKEYALKEEQKQSKTESKEQAIEYKNEKTMDTANSYFFNKNYFPKYELQNSNLRSNLNFQQPKESETPNPEIEIFSTNSQNNKSSISQKKSEPASLLEKCQKTIQRILPPRNDYNNEGSSSNFTSCKEVEKRKDKSKMFDVKNNLAIDDRSQLSFSTLMNSTNSTVSLPLNLQKTDSNSFSNIFPPQQVFPPQNAYTGFFYPQQMSTTFIYPNFPLQPYVVPTVIPNCNQHFISPLNYLHPKPHNNILTPVYNNVLIPNLMSSLPSKTIESHQNNQEVKLCQSKK